MRRGTRAGWGGVLFSIPATQQSKNGDDMNVEPAIPPHLTCPRTRPKRTPADFEAPYPAWTARYAEGAAPLVVAYFGAQQLALLPPDALAPIKAMFQTQPAPGYRLEAQCHDGAGFDTRVVIAYWQNAQLFADGSTYQPLALTIGKFPERRVTYSAWATIFLWSTRTPRSLKV